MFCRTQTNIPRPLVEEEAEAVAEVHVEHEDSESRYGNYNS